MAKSAGGARTCPIRSRGDGGAPRSRRRHPVVGTRVAGERLTHWLRACGRLARRLNCAVERFPASTNLSGRQRWRRATDNARRGVMGAPQVTGQSSMRLASQRVATSTGHRRAARASSQCFCSGRREQRAKLGHVGRRLDVVAGGDALLPHQRPSRPSGASRSASVIGGQATSAPRKRGGAVEASGAAARAPRCLPPNRG